MSGELPRILRAMGSHSDINVEMFVLVALWKIELEGGTKLGGGQP